MSISPVALRDIEVLIIDCQATGPHPEKSHLLEIGWGKFRLTDDETSEDFPIRAMRIAVPENIKVPAAVQRVTGISSSALAKGIAQNQVWGLLETDLGLRSTDRDERMPTVIHFARYEEPYLRYLHLSSRDQSPFPLNILCTWEISRRLLPHLPRRGLRAIAGYLGYSVPEMRRAYHHVKATASVWRTCVEMLGDEEGISTLKELQDWLQVPFKKRSTRKVYPMDSELRLNLPERPGVYRMLRSNGDILYVGKATSLKRRVNSYFQKQSRHPDHILEMLTQAQSITVSPTASAVEAALLESDEIKILSPPYNVALRTGERKIVFLSEDLSSAKASPDSIHILGPFPSIKPFDVYANLVRLLEDPVQDLAELFPSDLLDFSEEQIPDEDVFQTGIRSFLDRHGSLMKRQPPGRGVARINAHLWREHLRRREEAAAKSSEEEKKKNKKARTPWEWTPKRVARAMESVLTRGSHLRRRSNWLCLLSESTICWESRSKKARHVHVIRVEGGQLADRSSIELGSTVPIPAGADKLTLQRQDDFDLQTYDRLCVLTTELKRLVSQNRNVVVRLSARRTIESHRLAHILRWV